MAPAPYKMEREQDKIGADGKPVLDQDGEPIKEVVEIKVNAFKPVSTFDITQTDGEPLPRLGVEELTGSVEGYATLMEAIKQASPVPISFENIESGAKGYFHVEETVDEEFAFSKSRYGQFTGRSRDDDIIAYQIRQSFKPGEVTPEEANRIGYETAMRWTKGNHAFIVATHVDKAHIHNHIIYNSTTLDCYHKFRNFLFCGIALQAGYSKQFFEAHREEILLHKAAKEAFGQFEASIPKIKDLNREYSTLLKKKKDAYAEYRRIKEENKELQMAKHNLERFLNQQEEERKQKEKQQSKSGQSL